MEEGLWIVDMMVLPGVVGYGYAVVTGWWTPV